MDLITGPTGFIGTHLVKALIDKDSEIAILIRNKSSLDPSFKNAGIKIIEGDLTNIESLKKATENIDTIYHLAGYIGGAQPKDELFDQVNVKGTENLLKAAKINNVDKIVVVSSVAALGDVKEGQESTKCFPINQYGKSKLKMENICQKYAQSSKLKIIILRPSSIYGPREKGSFFNIIQGLRKNKFMIVGNGENRLNYLYIDDFVNVLIKSGEIIKLKKVNFETFIISGKAISMNQFINTLTKVLGVKKPIKIPYFVGLLIALFFEFIQLIIKNKKMPINLHRLKTMTLDRSFDISKAKRVLNFTQKVSLDEGTRKYIQWLDKLNSEEKK
jgi:nucleoside-diphosphate-sugar epimerase